jgi:two-component system response regulator PilR (NtrC family)
MALTMGGEIGCEDLQLAVKAPKDMAQMKSLPLQEYLDAVEKAAILEALAKTRFNKTAAAKLLGITFRALRYRLERLGMD